MSYEQQLAHRKSRYKIMMGMRIPLMIAAAACYQYPWVAVALLVISIPLPWMAVLIANDRLPKKIVDPHRYRAELDSTVADLKNLGGANAGASTAAEFLAHFAGDVPWAHIDIAGVAATERPKGWKTRGMSGFGARLLIQTLEQFDSVR